MQTKTVSQVLDLDFAILLANRYKGWVVEKNVNGKPLFTVVIVAN